MHIDKIMEDRLARFFDTLPPAAAAQLIKTIELARQQGRDEPVFEVVVKHAREVLREAGTHIEHLPTACRKFCEPFEDMLVGVNSCDKQIGRISRGSIYPVWNWLNQDLLPGELPDLAQKLEQALSGKDRQESDTLIAGFYKLLSEALIEAIAAVDDMDAERERRRLEARLGGPQVLADAKEMAMALSCAGLIAGLKAKIPQTITEFDGEVLKETVKLYQDYLKDMPENPEIFISIVLRRLKRKGQVLRIAKKIICKDDDMLIARSPHGIAGEILLYDMEVIAEKLAHDINSHQLASAILFDLRQFHVLAKGLTSEVRIDMKGPWGFRLVSVRKKVTELIEREISAVPRLIRLAVLGRTKIGKSAAPASESRLDPLNIIEAERALKILVGSRFLADQISLNATVTKFFKEIKQYLDQITERNISLIKEERARARDHAIESLEATVKLVRIIQGDDLAELILRRGQAAQANIEPDEALAS